MRYENQKREEGEEDYEEKSRKASIFVLSENISSNG